MLNKKQTADMDQELM
jgi:hypothetical protein